jgi:DsbC/DsbD-like thiol-disulfide interchange protein
MLMITACGPLRQAAASRAGAALCAIVLAAGTDGAVAGESASRWNGDVRSAVRLVAGTVSAGSRIRAGVEIRLKPGWHTYWRYPGDAGIPPRFDFAGSRNVKSVTVSWPAPRRIPEQGLIAIGYTTDVILPLAVVPIDPALPVTLRLKLDYAICEKLCVPAEGKSELVIAGGSSSQDAALRAAEARVPRRLALGEGSTLAVRSIRREGGAPRARVIVDVAGPPGAALFVEGPTPDWALPIPTPIEGAPSGVQRFAFELDGAPPGAKYERAAITLTAVSEKEAIEVPAHLD